MSHRTLAGPVTCETDRIKGSRFVADLAPVATVDDARAFVSRVREQSPDATHHCWAWRLGDGREQASDDGEPRDTAGAPILRHLTGAGLVDVVAVVTRWYGGTKLGRGGLIRAYGDATAAAIAAATIEEHVPTARLQIAHGYEDTAAVEATLHGYGAVTVEQHYDAAVKLAVAVVADRADELARALVDATAGRAAVTSTER